MILNPPLSSSTTTTFADKGITLPRSQSFLTTREKSMTILSRITAYSALKDKEMGSDDAYQELVKQITLKQNLDVWLKQLSECISLLKPSHKALFDAIFMFDWTQDTEIYGEFLVHLNSAHGVQYLNRSIINIIKNFIPKNIMNQPKFSIVSSLHSTLKRILEIIPDSINNIASSLKILYPHKSTDVTVQEFFLENLIELTNYCPILLEFIIGLIIDRLIQLDVEIVLDEIPDEDEEEEEEERDEIFKMEEDNNSKLKSNGHILSAKKLDTCISYIIKVIKNSPQPKRDDIFNALMQSFERSVLLTHQCKYTQFIIFFICQLNSQYMVTFVKDHLLSKLVDSWTSDDRKISACSYLASFLGRSKFVPIQCTIKSLRKLSKWIHKYISRYSSQIIEPQKHALFYTVVQSLFYILIWKQEELEDFLQGTLSAKLDINSIVNSQFRPLKVILSSVSSEFINLCRKLKIGYYTEKDINEEESFEYFFPFEPCLLKNTALDIQDYYAFWEDNNGIEDEDEDQVDEVCMMITSSVSL